MSDQGNQLEFIHEKLVLDILSAAKYHAFESWASAIDGSFARRGMLKLPSILQAKILAEYLRENKIEVNVHRIGDSNELRFLTPRIFENFILSKSLSLNINEKDKAKIEKYEAKKLKNSSQITYENSGYTLAAIERLTDILNCSEEILVDA